MVISCINMGKPNNLVVVVVVVVVVAAAVESMHVNVSTSLKHSF